MRMTWRSTSASFAGCDTRCTDRSAPRPSPPRGPAGSPASAAGASRPWSPPPAAAPGPALACAAAEPSLGGRSSGMGKGWMRKIFCSSLSYFLFFNFQKLSLFAFLFSTLSRNNTFVCLFCIVIIIILLYYCIVIYNYNDHLFIVMDIMEKFIKKRNRWKKKIEND